MWVFSDGTVVHLGGLIEGATIFAQQLRARLSEPHLHPRIVVGVPPAPWLKVDLSDTAMVNAWLEDELETRRVIWSRAEGTPIRTAKPPIRIIQRPENIPPLPVNSHPGVGPSSEPGPGVVY